MEVSAPQEIRVTPKSAEIPKKTFTHYSLAEQPTASPTEKKRIEEIDGMFNGLQTLKLVTHKNKNFSAGATDTQIEEADKDIATLYQTADFMRIISSFDGIRNPDLDLETLMANFKHGGDVSCAKTREYLKEFMGFQDGGPTSTKEAYLEKVDALRGDILTKLKNTLKETREQTKDMAAEEEQVLDSSEPKLLDRYTLGVARVAHDLKNRVGGFLFMEMAKRQRLEGKDISRKLDTIGNVFTTLDLYLDTIDPLILNEFVIQQFSAKRFSDLVYQNLLIGLARENSNIQVDFVRPSGDISSQEITYWDLHAESLGYNIGSNAKDHAFSQIEQFQPDQADSRPKNIRVEFGIANDMLEMIVTDSGKGFRGMKRFTRGQSSRKDQGNQGIGMADLMAALESSDIFHGSYEIADEIKDGKEVGGKQIYRFRLAQPTPESTSG
jgi:hypothetical protein